MGGGAVRAVKWGRSRFWGIAALTSRFGGGSVRGGPGGGGGRSAVGGSRILGAFQGVLFFGGGSRFRGEGLPVWGEGGGGVPGGAPRTPLAPALLRGSAPTGTGSGTPSHPTPPPAASRWRRPRQDGCAALSQNGGRGQRAPSCPRPTWRPRPPPLLPRTCGATCAHWLKVGQAPPPSLLPIGLIWVSAPRPLAAPMAAPRDQRPRLRALLLAVRRAGRARPRGRRGHVRGVGGVWGGHAQSGRSVARARRGLRWERAGKGGTGGLYGL